MTNLLHVIFKKLFSSEFYSCTRMNMPIDKEGRVSFTTTLFALIRDNLKINVRESAEMDQADLELRATIMKVS